MAFWKLQWLPHSTDIGYFCTYKEDQANNPSTHTPIQSTALMNNIHKCKAISETVFWEGEAEEQLHSYLLVGCQVQIKACPL